MCSHVNLLLLKKPTNEIQEAADYRLCELQAFSYIGFGEEIKMCRYRDYFYLELLTITNTLAWRHTSKSEALLQVHDVGFLFGTLLRVLGSSPNNFIDVYLFPLQNE